MEVHNTALFLQGTYLAQVLRGTYRVRTYWYLLGLYLLVHIKLYNEVTYTLYLVYVPGTYSRKYISDYITTKHDHNHILGSDFFSNQ